MSEVKYEKSELDYMAGERRVYINLLAMAISGLRDAEHTEPLDAAILLKERAEAVAVLRHICEEHGDNDWKDNLHLADIIEKHLGRHLTRQQPPD